MNTDNGQCQDVFLCITTFNIPQIIPTTSNNFFSPLSDVILDNITIFIRFRTAINVLGDSIGAGIVYHLSKAELDTAAELRDHNGGEARDREDSGSLTAVTPHQNGDKMRILGSNHNHAIY